MGFSVHRSDRTRTVHAVDLSTVHREHGTTTTWRAAPQIYGVSKVSGHAVFAWYIAKGVRVSLVGGRGRVCAPKGVGGWVHVKGCGVHANVDGCACSSDDAVCLEKRRSDAFRLCNARWPTTAAALRLRAHVFWTESFSETHFHGGGVGSKLIYGRKRFRPPPPPPPESPSRPSGKHRHSILWETRLSALFIPFVLSL